MTKLPSNQCTVPETNRRMREPSLFEGKAEEGEKVPTALTTVIDLVGESGERRGAGGDGGGKDWIKFRLGETRFQFLQFLSISSNFENLNFDKTDGSLNPSVQHGTMLNIPDGKQYN